MWFLLLLAAAAAQRPPAPPTLPFNTSNTLSNSAVLQRDVNAALFGFGPVFCHFTVSLFNASSTSAEAIVPGIIASDGTWRVTMPSKSAGGPYSLVGQLLPGMWLPPNATMNWTLTDIYFGDVVHCGGQSNMAYGLGGTKNAAADIAASVKYSNIRFVSAAFSFQNFSQAQQADVNPWVVASPSTVGGFSAVCYLTATRLSDAFNGTVPFGLIDSAVGGTAAQLWLPPRYAASCADERVGEDWGAPWTLSCWFNGMASPWTAHDIKFFLWDQGENNVGGDPNLDLACLTKSIIVSWREAWHAATAPFIFVELPEYVRANNTELAAAREAQLAVADSLPNVGFAVTADLGDAYTVCDESHPPNCYDGSIHNRAKDLVADRLTPVVLAIAYNMTGVSYLSPRYAGAAQTADSTVRVTFDAASLTPDALPLEIHAPAFDSNSSWCPNDGVNRFVLPESCDWFSVLYSDGVWRNATVTVDPSGDAIVLSTPGTPTGLTAVATRNGYADWPVVSVFTKSGLPVVPWGPRNISN